MPCVYPIFSNMINVHHHLCSSLSFSISHSLFEYKIRSKHCLLSSILPPQTPQTRKQTSQTMSSIYATGTRYKLAYDPKYLQQRSREASGARHHEILSRAREALSAHIQINSELRQHINLYAPEEGKRPLFKITK